MRGWMRRVLMAVLGLATSAGALAFAFFRPVAGAGAWSLVPRFDLGRWLHELPAQATWLVPFFLLSGSLPALRAIVWGFTAPAPAPPFSVRYHALALGALVHNTLPGRLGLLVSGWFAARRVGRPTVELLASLLVSKLLEISALAAAIAIASPLVQARVSGDSALSRTAIVALVLVGGLAVLLVSAAVAAPKLADRLERARRAPRLARALAALATGARGVGSLRRLAQGLLAASGPVAAAGVAYGLTLVHARAAAGLAGGWLLLGTITLGQFTPGLPIGTGVYLLACTWTARALGASDADAAAVAVLSDLTTVAANLTVGAASALAHRRELGEFMAFRRRAAKAA